MMPNANDRLRIAALLASEWNIAEKGLGGNSEPP
jgi:hypothetical protein